MKTILFLHGFYASGSCMLAQTLKKSFEGKALVLTPDLPLHPKEALKFVKDICIKESVDMLIANSCGSFLAQMTASSLGIPALLGNPHFKMTEFLKERMGENSYKSARADGKMDFIIDEALINEFKELEEIQFNKCNTESADKIWGLFGEHDAIAHYKDLFLQHYNHAFSFPGGHAPTEDEAKKYYVPLAEKILF